MLLQAERCDIVVGKYDEDDDCPAAAADVDLCVKPNWAEYCVQSIAVERSGTKIMAGNWEAKIKPKKLDKN